MSTFGLHPCSSLETQWDPSHRFLHEDEADLRRYSSSQEHPQVWFLKARKGNTAKHKSQQTYWQGKSESGNPKPKSNQAYRCAIILFS